MPLRFDLKDQNPVTQTSMWIDLTNFPLNTPDAPSEIGIVPEQLEFARAEVLPSKYPKVCSTIYYRDNIVTYNDVIIQHFGQVQNSYGVFTKATEEDFHLVPMRNPFSFEGRPTFGVVYSMAFQNAYGERVTVLRKDGDSRRLVRYRYRDNSSYHFSKRFASLLRHSQEILVTNSSIRDIFRIADV